MVQIQLAATPADLGAIPTARSVALAGRGRNTGGRHRIATVTLAEVLDAEVSVTLAVRGAQLHGHRLAGEGSVGERAVVRVIGIAPLGGIRGRDAGGFLVEVEMVAAAAGFRRVAGAGEAASRGYVLVASGVEVVAAVAFAAVLDAEEIEVRAGCGAFLHGHAVVEVRAAGQGAPVGGLGVTSGVGVASYGSSRSGVQGLQHRCINGAYGKEKAKGANARGPHVCNWKRRG